MVKPDNSEEKIAESALNVFVSKGFAGARMQEIADDAGVNKALLNYYFRSKEKLFEFVFKRIFRPMVDNLVSIAEGEADIFTSIENLVRKHFQFIRRHPEGPLLIAKELSSSRNKINGTLSKVLVSQIKDSGMTQIMMSRLQTAVEAGEIRPLDPVQLIISIISMNIMYVILKPIFLGIFDAKITDYSEFEKQREDEIVNLVISSLKNKNYKPINRE